MRTECFMVGARLNTSKTGLQVLVDAMVYKKGDKFYILETELLPEVYDFSKLARVNLTDFIESEKEDGGMMGYQINRTWDGRNVTMLGAGYLYDGALFRVTEIDEELLGDGETYEDNIFYTRIYTKLTKKQNDTLLASMEEDTDFWDLHREQSFVDTNLMYFRSLGDLGRGQDVYTEEGKQAFEGFAKSLAEATNQNQLKGLVSEVLTGLTAELEVANTRAEETNTEESEMKG
ncbi:hypothetical protein [Bacillus thuringiensis]|uniref:hypothetical protein n=1 Tax=Bacillus thuringiensis TaxID=1428 RepID=UPI000BFCB72F|nr:hypothetical protein [Bacillus thuringiensis]PGT90015.1 hypothetical protein COD17_09705 [Bacillus thuringiensis]